MKKKLTSILVLCAMAFTLTLPVSASQPLSGEMQPRAQECGNCGRMTLSTVKVNTYETGPTSRKCSHGHTYGDDLVYTQYITYQYKCSSCTYKSATWSTPSGTRVVCYGHN